MSCTFLKKFLKNWNTACRDISMIICWTASGTSFTFYLKQSSFQNKTQRKRSFLTLWNFEMSLPYKRKAASEHISYGWINKYFVDSILEQHLKSLLRTIRTYTFRPFHYPVSNCSTHINVLYVNLASIINIY